MGAVTLKLLPALFVRCFGIGYCNAKEYMTCRVRTFQVLSVVHLMLQTRVEWETQNVRACVLLCVCNHRFKRS